MDFKDLQKMAYNVCDSTGWHDNPFNFEARIDNIHSEAREAFDAYRKHGQDMRKTWYSVTRRHQDFPQVMETTILESDSPEVLYKTREAYNFVNTGKFPDRPAKPEGVPSELADIIIWIMDACELMDVDLEEAIIQKLNYNRSRDYRHGGLPY